MNPWSLCGVLPARSGLNLDVAPEGRCRRDDDRKAARPRVDDAAVGNEPVVRDDDTGSHDDVLLDDDTSADPNVIADRLSHDDAVIADDDTVADRDRSVHEEGDLDVVAKLTLLAESRISADHAVFPDDETLRYLHRLTAVVLDLLVAAGAPRGGCFGHCDHSPCFS